MTVEELEKIDAHCCKNVATEGPFQQCGQPALLFYQHDDSICGYCLDHDYECGKLVHSKVTMREFARWQAVKTAKELMNEPR